MNRIRFDKIIPVAELLREKAVLLKAAEILRSDGLVVAPTETRYGLLSRADSQGALERMLKAKGRPEDMAVAVFFDSREAIFAAGELSSAAMNLVDNFLPGPLTLILNATSKWPTPITPRGKIGIRYSTSPLIASLLRESRVPLTATSANFSGQKNNQQVEDIRAELGDQVSLYVDGGLLNGPLSTVIDCSSNEYKILREGAITAAQIESALQEVEK
ncbi:MAG: L-threonylcarbamoyladenylate synthase [bacterium]|nr:L-threonylcarbamoyladenylate synthase [bacterium]